MEEDTDFVLVNLENQPEVWQQGALYTAVVNGHSIIFFRVAGTGIIAYQIITNHYVIYQYWVSTLTSNSD